MAISFGLNYSAKQLFEMFVVLNQRTKVPIAFNTNEYFS